MVLSSDTEGRRTLAQSRTLPLSLTSISRAEDLEETGQRRKSSTLPYNISGDVPIFSRNIPSAFSVAYSSDKEEISFSNSMLYLEEDTRLPRTLSPANLEADLVSPSHVNFKVPLHHPGLPPGSSSWFDGIMGCFKPVWTIMGKNKPINVDRGEESERVVRASTAPTSSENNNL